jgi:hypothetical protein
MSVNYVKSILDTPDKRTSFETFRGNTCHLVKSLGDNEFIIQTLESDIIRTLYEREWYPESFYLLAMTDYLCRENDCETVKEYIDLRKYTFEKPMYPVGIKLLSLLKNNDEPLKEAMKVCIPEFKNFNIIESDIRNVC